MEDVSQETQKEETQPEAEAKVEEVKSTTPVIDAAKEQNDRKEELLKKEHELLDRKEAIIAKQMVGGSAEGGLGEPKPDEPQDYAKKLQAGDAKMDDFFDTTDAAARKEK